VIQCSNLISTDGSELSCSAYVGCFVTAFTGFNFEVMGKVVRAVESTRLPEVEEILILFVLIVPPFTLRT
jgi:hypothetical protein